MSKQPMIFTKVLFLAVLALLCLVAAALPFDSKGEEVKPGEWVFTIEVRATEPNATKIYESTARIAASKNKLTKQEIEKIYGTRAKPNLRECILFLLQHQIDSGSLSKLWNQHQLYTLPYSVEQSVVALDRK